MMKVSRPSTPRRIEKPSPRASTSVIRTFVRTLERLGPSPKPAREGGR
jgi:hypothetical protein